jgi:hypothetical protein
MCWRRATAERLISAPNSDVAGKRDRALFSVLIGCGLRRSEAAALAFTHIQQREGRWVIVDLVGKHGRIRSVPMPAWAKVAIDEWSTAAGIHMGRVFRPVNKGDRLTRREVSLGTVSGWRCANTLPGWDWRTWRPRSPEDLCEAQRTRGPGEAGTDQLRAQPAHSRSKPQNATSGVKQNLADALAITGNEIVLSAPESKLAA